MLNQRMSLPNKKYCLNNVHFKTQLEENATNEQKLDYFIKNKNC